jgi:hypothetical protein
LSSITSKGPRLTKEEIDQIYNRLRDWNGQDYPGKAISEIESMLAELYQVRQKLDSSNTVIFSTIEKIIDNLNQTKTGILNSSINQSIEELINKWDIDKYNELEKNLANINFAIFSLNIEIEKYKTYTDELILNSLDKITTSWDYVRDFSEGLEKNILNTETGLSAIAINLNKFNQFNYALWIYRIASGNYESTRISSYPGTLEWKNVLVGIIFGLFGLMIMFMICFYVARRYFIIMLYFIVTPIFAINGTVDNGSRFRKIINSTFIKFISISILVFILSFNQLLTEIVYSLIRDSRDVSGFQKTFIMAIFSFMGIVTALSFTKWISKIIGDEGSGISDISEDIGFVGRGVTSASRSLNPLVRASRGLAIAHATVPARLAKNFVSQKYSESKKRRSQKRNKIVE